MSELEGNAQLKQHHNDVQAAIDAGIALAVPHEIDRDAGIYSFVVPNGGTIHTVDLERYAQTPRRAHAVYAPATVEALMAVIHRHSDTDASTIWVHPSSGRIIAVFNDNDGNARDPGWRDHRAELQLQPTPEWQHWTSHDGALLSQVQFAEHVEDGLKELVDPPAADMLELAQTIQAAQNANFRSAVRLSNGQIQARYEETIDAKAGESGQLDIPTEFKLAIAPFIGENPYEVNARFRYRLNGGKLAMGYKLDRPDDVVRDALDKIAERLIGEFQGIDVFIGSPGPG